MVLQRSSAKRGGRGGAGHLHGYMITMEKFERKKKAVLKGLLSWWSFTRTTYVKLGMLGIYSRCASDVAHVSLGKPDV